MPRRCLEEDAVAIDELPLHRREVRVALDGLAEMVDAVGFRDCSSDTQQENGPR